MIVALVVAESFDLERTRDVIARLREKHPNAEVVMDSTARAGAIAQKLDLAGIAFLRADYLDVADRILVFGPHVEPVRTHTVAGKPTVVYTADGHDVYDEALFVATLISELGAREVHDDDERRVKTPRPGFDLDTHLQKQRAKNALDKARDEIASAEDPIPANTGTPAEAESAMTLFDAPAEKPSGSGAYGATRGEAEAVEAMTRIDANTDDAWKTRADTAILKTGLSLPTFISDDVWRYLDADVHDPRALGPRINQAARLGLIEKTGAYRASDRRHAAPVVEWQLTEHGRRVAA